MKKIIQENGNKIRQIIRNIIGRYDEDLEQEVYLKTYKNLDKYNEQNKFSQWISTIAANVARDYLRSANFKNTKNTDYDCDKLTNVKTQKTPEKEYSLKERQKLTLKAINSLPKKLKRAIILYEFEDMSYEKIAQKEHIPTGTVKSRISSARKILKEKLYFLIGEDC